MSSTPIHPRLQALFALTDILTIAAETGARRAKAAIRRRTPRGRVRRPGADTPMWNTFATELRGALQPRGAKVRLARYLGVPKQRIRDFVTGRHRLPDAELTLRMLHWLIENQAGRDRAL
jgi:hypothetical protein